MRGHHDPRYNGAGRLARELGVSHQTVRKRMANGMTLDEARADIEQRAAMIAAGLPVKGAKSPDLCTPMPGQGGKPYHEVADEIERGYKPQRATPDSRHAKDEPDDGDGTVESMASIQKRKEKGLADQQEMKAAMMRGELVEAAAVELWMTNQIVKARDLFLRIGAELGDRLAAETNPHKCAEMVENKVREALSVMKVEGMPGTTGAASE